MVERLHEEAGNHSLLLLLVGGPEPFHVHKMPDVPRLRLEGLPEDAFVEFGRALFRDGYAPGERWLLAAGETLSFLPGNLVEALEHLQAEGGVDGRPGDFHDLPPDPPPLAPAKGLLTRLLRRLEAVPSHVRFVLQAAAVLGDRFPLDDLTELVGQPELHVLECLGVFQGRVIRSLRGEASFRHRAFRRAVLRQMPENFPPPAAPGRRVDPGRTGGSGSGGGPAPVPGRRAQSVPAAAPGRARAVGRRRLAAVQSPGRPAHRCPPQPSAR